MAAGIERREPGGFPWYARSDFSGEPLEMAYLIGFRLGDLHVALEQNTVVVKCSSTRHEQVDLFRCLFEAYGHVYTDEATLARRRRQSIGMEVRLNRSFDFLLPKEDAVPEWILANDEAFFSFFAGYVDAEGYVKVALPRGYQTPQVRVEIRSYEWRTLQQVPERLHAQGIDCPEPSVRVAAGYVNKYGVRSNQAVWGLGISRSDALLALFQRIGPYMRHGRRRRDMEGAIAALRLPRNRGRRPAARDEHVPSHDGSAL